jgi:hypothetical protein
VVVNLSLLFFSGLITCTDPTDKSLNSLGSIGSHGAVGDVGGVGMGNSVLMIKVNLILADNEEAKSKTKSIEQENDHEVPDIVSDLPHDINQWRDCIHHFDVGASSHVKEYDGEALKISHIMDIKSLFPAD